MSLKPLEVRLKIPHERKTDSDIYITKDMKISALLLAISKKLQQQQKITLHATGAANYKALKLAALVQDHQKDSIIARVSTRTIKTTSFTLPSKAGETRERKEKNINGIDIELSHK